MKTSFAIATAGAVGLAVILRAAGYYAGADAIAFGITLLMAAAFAAAIVELVQVARRTGQLQAELQAFPEAASYDHVTRATPLLRALLSARLDRTVLPVPGPTFAPFVAGLLVMLGLLGTFLGLFATLRGAGQALTASTDIDALRAALKAPIGGLMRGFGTSAAGVASSAALGLAMVFARREVNRLGLSLHAMASGPLARFTPAHRQLLALETLAEQGAAWPTAARALGEAALTLKGLEASWVQAHEQAASRTREQLEAATATIRGELQAAIAQGRELAGATLQRGIERTAEATHAAVRPLLEAAGHDVLHAMQSHLHEVRAALGGEAQAAAERAAALHARIESAAEQAAERDTARATALARAAEAMQRDLGEATAAVREQMQHGAQADATQQARAEALLGRLSEASAAISAAAQQHVTVLQQFVEVTDGRLRESEARGDARQQALLGRLLELAEAQSGRLVAFERELSAQHAAAAERLSERAAAFSEKLEHELQLGIERTASATRAAVGPLLEAATAGVRERMQQGAEADAAQQARAETLLGRLSETSAAIAAAAQQHVAALQQFVEVTDGRLRESEARGDARQQALLARLLELADTQAVRLAGFERALSEQHAAAADRLTERASVISGELAQDLQETAALVKQAGTLIHGGGIEMAAVAEAFAAAVEQQREGARAWLESLGDLERAVVQAGEVAAADVLGRHLSRTHEVFDRQLQFQQELIDQLRGARRDSMLQAAVDAAG